VPVVQVTLVVAEVVVVELAVCASEAVEDTAVLEELAPSVVVVESDSGSHLFVVISAVVLTVVSLAETAAVVEADAVLKEAVVATDSED